MLEAGHCSQATGRPGLMLKAGHSPQAAGRLALMLETGHIPQAEGRLALMLEASHSSSTEIELGAGPRHRQARPTVRTVQETHIVVLVKISQSLGVPHQRLPLLCNFPLGPVGAMGFFHSTPWGPGVLPQHILQFRGSPIAIPRSLKFYGTSQELQGSPQRHPELRGSPRTSQSLESPLAHYLPEP